MTENLLHAHISNLLAVEDQTGIMAEAMLAIRNICEGRMSWWNRSPKDKISAIQALSDLMHNFVPGNPVKLSVVRSQFAMQRERSPEAFELCPRLVHWATRTDDTDG